MGGNGEGKRHRWRISFRRSSSNLKSEPRKPPTEFVCAITKTLMSDPVIVASGQTFERTAVQVCKDLNFTPVFPDEPAPDFSTVIPNRNIRSAITNWCKSNRVGVPIAPDYYEVESLVKSLVEESRKHRVSEFESDERSGSIGASERDLLRGVAENPQVGFSHAATEMNFRQPAAHFYSSSEESVVVSQSPGSSTPLPFATKPACFFSSSSSDLMVEQNLSSEISSSHSSEEDEIVTKLQSIEVFEQEESLILLRKVTKSNEEARVSLCTLRLLTALKPLVVSRYAVVQVNAVAALVNLSLEKVNKLKIVRLGFVPQLIDLLKGGSPEVQEHAAGAIFSLSLEEDNKTAIGALGALQPLLHALRAESQRTRSDAALALYHLSLIPTNRNKLVKLGAVSTLLTLLRGKNMTERVILVLCNLAACAEGKSAMLDGNAVGIIVEMLRENLIDSEATQANMVAALYSLSYGSLRFRGLAKEAGAADVLRMVEERGGERAKEKARRILQMMRGSGDDGDGEDMEDGGGALLRGRYRAGMGGAGGGKNLSTVF
uniref:RING-type E3 ubiquitin transferase n=1 Tax=Kalanchoe fedtschenkoi TaxID=63787 RepID=A0A7N0V0M1_KALFE